MLKFPFVVAMVVVVGLVGYASEPKPTKAIEGRYATLNQAFLKKDLDKAEAIFTKDCVVRIQGEPTKLRTPEYFELVRKSFKFITVQKTSTKIDSMTEVKGKAGQWSVTATSHSEYVYTPPKTGKTTPKPQKLKRDQTVSDVWVHSAKGWQISSRKVMDSD